MMEEDLRVALKGIVREFDPKSLWIESHCPFPNPNLHLSGGSSRLSHVPIGKALKKAPGVKAKE